MKINTLIVAMLLILASCNISQFDAEKWKKGNKRQRGKMSSNLVKGQLLVNKTKKEVTKMLGSPDGKNGDCILYNLDLGGHDWMYTLQVCFDDQHGKATYVQIND